MKTRMGFIGTAVAVVLALGMGYRLQANAGAIPLDKIGVVSVMRVLQESKKNAAQMQALQMERAQHQAELQRLSQELETDQGILQTLLPGSEDHLKQLKAVFDKQATLESRKQYYQQLLAAKEQEMTQKVYRQALEVTAQVAEAQGLTLVLEQSPPEFPIPAERFLFAISSHKVVYAKGCVDITDAVLAEVDK